MRCVSHIHRKHHSVHPRMQTPHIRPECRFQAAAPACRRLRAACLDPSLLHSVSAIIRDESAAALLHRLQSLLAFLAAHVADVRSFEVSLHGAACDAALTALECDEQHALVGGCLALCCAAGQLQELRTVGVPLPSCAWLVGAARLHSLELVAGVGGQVRLPPLAHLFALTNLALEAHQVHLGTLPVSLLRLLINDHQTSQLPHQLSKLSGLSSLHLMCTRHEQPSLDMLSSLPALRRLLLTQTERLPTCLSTLTRLQALTMQLADAAGDEAVLASAFPSLTLLTCLVINSTQMASLPPSITALSRLQRLWVQLSSNRASDLPPAAHRWPVLRWLGLPWAGLVGSVASGGLPSATALQYLSVLDMPELFKSTGERPDDVQPRWAAAWRFIRMHPSLRCFGIDSTDEPSLELFDAMLDLKLARPGLLLQRTTRDGGLSFWEEIIQCEGLPTGAG
ncbi:hypothetical protein ABPG75_006398 [Micractinium tetrahymenae]